MENYAFIYAVLYIAAWSCIVFILLVALRERMQRKIHTCQDDPEKQRLHDNYLALLFCGIMLWVSGIIAVVMYYSLANLWSLLVIPLLALPMFLKDYKRKSKKLK